MIEIEKVKGVSGPPFPSPVTSSLHEAGGVVRVVGQSLTVVAATPLNPMTTGAVEAWPASPHGDSLS